MADALGCGAALERWEKDRLGAEVGHIGAGRNVVKQAGVDELSTTLVDAWRGATKIGERIATIATGYVSPSPRKRQASVNTDEVGGRALCDTHVTHLLTMSLLNRKYRTLRVG